MKRVGIWVGQRARCTLVGHQGELTLEKPTGSREKKWGEEDGMERSDIEPKASGAVVKPVGEKALLWSLLATT